MTDALSPDRRPRVMAIITAALMMGVLFFTGTVAVLLTVGGFQPVAAPFTKTLLTFAAFAGGIAVLVAPMLRSRLIESPPGSDEDAIARRWTTGTLVAMALREFAGLQGLVFSLLAGSLPWALGFGLASVAAMGLAWPRGDDLADRLRRATS